MSEKQTASEGWIERRTYLQLTAMLSGAGLVGGSMTEQVAARENDDVSAEAIQERVQIASGLRDDSAEELVEGLELYAHSSNGDESYEFPEDFLIEPVAHPMAYQKGLPLWDNAEADPDEAGIADPSDYETYQEIVTGESDDTWTDIPQGDERQFVSPNSSHSFLTEGMDSWLGTMRPAPSFDSDFMGHEMLDCYWMAIHRDEPFVNYDEIGIGSDYDDATPTDDHGNTWFDSGEDGWWFEDDGLFRGPFDGTEHGPYISQFLLADVNYGAIPVTPEIEPLDGTDYGTDEEEWRDIIRGDGKHLGAEPGPQTTEDDLRFISTGRDLAAFVRTDPSYHPYVTAALWLLGNDAPLDQGLPFVDSDPVFPYIDHGAVSVLDMVARVARNALVAAWHHKWRVHRRLRPETFGGRIHFNDVNPGTYDWPLPDSLNNTEALTEIGADGTLFLPLAYGEGSPAHPAYPSGHSAIAGACATVLKTFFQNVSIGNELYRSTEDGGRESITSFNPPFIHGEINKLVSNIGLGRLFAGVHYITDHVAGAHLGQQIAVATMLDAFEFATERSDTDVTFTDLYGTERTLSFDTLEDLREERHTT